MKVKYTSGRIHRSIRSVPAILALALVMALLSANTVQRPTSAAAKQDAVPETPQAVFTNSTPITIGTGAPGNGVPYPSPIVVSGLVGNIPATPGSVKVTLNNFSHTFPDDLALVLVGPTGAALLIQDGAGDINSAMVGITYTISDDGAAQLPDLTSWPAGTYKPAAYYTGDSFPAPGPLLAYNHPGPAVGGGTATLTSTFGGTAPNGTWNLFVRDFVTGDGGSYAGGWSLEINVAGGPSNCTSAKRPVDMDGDGKTDLTLARNTGGGPGGQLTWFTHINGGADAPARNWGSQGDEFVPNDYDGDGKTDIAVWRRANAAYYILQSQSNTFVAAPFGITTDDPRVVGDYDGDGKSDLAVYRSGAVAGAHSFWFYQSSVNGSIISNEWGQNGDFPAPGDYDGDGKFDFVVQRNHGGGTAAFHELLSGGGTANFVFGTPTDVIVPGLWDSDCKTDIATVRGLGGVIYWNILNSATGTLTQQFWGNSATDFVAQGDYDGDGRIDFAVWRPDADPTRNYFYWLGSTSGASGFEWGQNGDYPVANFNTH
jgi:hypothetical protein